MRFKNLEEKLERESPKRTIFVSSGLGNGIRVRHRVVCQRGRWAPKGVDCEIPHRLERGTSASEDVGPRKGGGS